MRLLNSHPAKQEIMGFILLNLALFTYLRNSRRAEQFLLSLPHKKQSIRGGAENEPRSPPVSSHNLVPQEPAVINQLLSGPAVDQVQSL